MLEHGIRGNVAISSTATRTCAYAREARASETTTRSSVGHRRRGRALLGHNIKRPGDHAVIHGAPVAYPRGAHVVRRRRIAVVTPESFAKVCKG